MIATLSAQGQFEDAVDAGLTVLSDLGETFRKDVGREDMLFEYQKVKHALASSLTGSEDLSINDIIARTPSLMNNDDIDKDTAQVKADAMRLIVHLARTTYQYNPFLQPTLSLRAIQLSMSYGLCQYSIAPFASYGVLLASRFMNIEEANRVGNLSLDLIERFDAMEEMPRIYLIVYSYIFPCVRPVQSLIPDLRRVYDIGMRSGSTEVAMVICRQLSHILLSCDGASSLEQTSKEMQEYTYQMKKHKQTATGKQDCILQFFLILMGDGGEDPSVLSGRVMNYEKSLKEALSRGAVVEILEIKTIRLRLFYLFGEYDEAGKLVKDVLGLHNRFPSIAYHGKILGDVLYIGLTAAVLGCSNQHESDEWNAIAESTLKAFEQLASHSEWNFAHRVELMKAEIAYFAQYDDEGALKHYKAAIDLAGRHKFPGERALALERTAICCEGTFKEDLARKYYKEAERAYREWGATRKADVIASCMTEVDAVDLE
mmetsp:Transcript_13929/g.40056  ORF Transcript_13929/g.40056 Transcript_13929/m.40056 type:complete len:487 (+) Transcript_13929:1723-3183(+)